MLARRSIRQGRCWFRGVAWPLVVILNGPIGAGKSTIGTAVATRLGGIFIESDDLGDPNKAWFEQVGEVNAEIVTRSLHALTKIPLVLVARPLRDEDWVALRDAFAVSNVDTKCITLAATYEAITTPARGRTFSQWELDRIREMITEGYDQRSFSDAILRTDQESFEHCVDVVAAMIEKFWRSQ
jgi:cytidylate kinase